MQVEEPGDYQAVADLIKKASEEHRTVAPRGGGTMMDLGAPVPPADITVSSRNLCAVLDYQPANLTVRTQAGITLGALNRALGEHGQFLPLDAPFPDVATIGGIIATNTSGSLRVRFGTARDQLIGLRAALADGQVVHGGGDVVKNVAGYDLPKLFIGSLGTLGMIVEATFKVAPLPAKRATIAAGFEEMGPATALALRVLRSSMLPFGLEMLDRKASVELGLGDRSLCVARFGGVPGAVAQQIGQVEEWAVASGAADITILDSDEKLWSRLRDFMFEKATLVKIGVMPSQVAQLAAQAQDYAARYGMGCVLLAHAIGIIYIALEGLPEGAVGAITLLRESALACNGHLVVLRAPEELAKRVDVWGPAPRGLGLMKKLKQELDPNGVLNPGRFVGGL